MKTCTKCGITRPLSDFTRDKQRPDGLRPSCKDCKAEWRRKHYSENRESILEKVRLRHAANPEKKAQYNREYYAANREAAAEYSRRHYAENREAIARSAKVYRTANPHIQWEYYYAKRSTRYGFTPVVESFTRDELTARWGESCWHCGGTFEQIDHFPVAVINGGSHTVENCRPSCADCNQRTWREVVPGDVG